MTRRRAPVIDGRKRCACATHEGDPWQPVENFHRVRGDRLASWCNTCQRRSDHERTLRECPECHERKPGTEFNGRTICIACCDALALPPLPPVEPRRGPAPLGYCPPWTPPAPGDRLGYCPRCGWAWSNGAGPTACACGRQFTETVTPARVCESVRA